MDALLIVKAQVGTQALPRLTWRRVVVQIHLLLFDSTPQPFSENVVQCVPFAIHADAHIMRKQQLRVLRAGKLAALIAIPNLRPGLRERSLHRLDHESDLHGLIQFAG